MEKTKDSTKAALHEQWKKAVSDYLNELLRMWDLDARYGYWGGDESGTVYHYGDSHHLTVDDIIYIVEADIEEGEVLEWEDYLLLAHEFGFDMPNLWEWHRGCPRTPKETFDALRELKDTFARAVEEEKERVKNEPQRNPILDKEIVDCEVSMRTINICLSNGIKTLGDLVKLHKADCQKFRNCGRKSLGELDGMLTAHGLEWAKNG